MSQIFGWPLGLLAFVLYLVFPNYGIVLIIFTILTRILLLPFAIKQQKSSAKMVSFQPKMQELQKKYANDKTRYQQELMKLYQEEKYNPMAGCLPLLIQFPILFGIIDVVYKPLTHFLRLKEDMITTLSAAAKEITGTEILQRTSQLDLVRVVSENKDQFLAAMSGNSDIINNIVQFRSNMFLFGLDLGATPQLGFSPLMAIPILSAVLSFLSIHLAFKLNPAATATTPQMSGVNKGMKIIMPAFSFYLAFSYPLGVGLYWTVGYIVAIGQTFFMRKFYNTQKMAEEIRLQSEKENEKKKIVKEIVVNEDGTETVSEETVSQKELNKRRLAEARRREAEKYGDVYKEDEE